MAKKSERSLLLIGVLFAFVCLLLSGGWRLIGSDMQEENPPVRPYASVRAMLSSMPAPQSQTADTAQRKDVSQRAYVIPVPENRIMNPRVSSDANGNVLAGKTYMRAVYQAFVLDDGFV